MTETAPDAPLLPSMPKPVESNLPVQTLRHRNLKAVIWRNHSDKGQHQYSVTVSRSYRDGDAWKDSRSFSYDEIMNVAKLLYDAHSFITELRASEHAGQRPARKPTVLMSRERPRRSGKSA